MENLIKKVYNDKMSDGSFETIIATKFDEMVKDICRDLMTWNGTIKKQMESKIEPLISSAIEKSDFDSYTVKVTSLINEALKQTSANELKNYADNLQALLGDKSKHYQFLQKVKISEIFKLYVEFIEQNLDEDDFDEDELENLDYSKHAYLNCNCAVEKVYENTDTNFFYSKDKYKVTLTNDKAEENYEIAVKSKIVFYIEESYDNKFKVKINHDFTLSELRNLPPFILQLLDMANNSCDIKIDRYNMEDTADIEIGYDN